MVTTQNLIKRFSEKRNIKFGNDDIMQLITPACDQFNATAKKKARLSL